MLLKAAVTSILSLVSVFFDIISVLIPDTFETLLLKAITAIQPYIDYFLSLVPSAAGIVRAFLGEGAWSWVVLSFDLLIVVFDILLAFLSFAVLRWLFNLIQNLPFVD